MSSRRERRGAAKRSRRCSSLRSSESLRASRSFFMATSSSPTFGVSSKPEISAGMPGVAFLIFSPRSLSIVFTLPAAAPQMKGIPTLSVPLCTITVAELPLPCSKRDSMMEARQLARGLAFSSSTSACRQRRSSRLSMPAPVAAETSTHSTSPPKSVGMSPSSISCVRTRVGSAAGRSHLLTATMIVLLAALACIMASLVCGMMPSLAATTSTTMSVTSAPRARISVKMA